MGFKIKRINVPTFNQIITKYNGNNWLSTVKQFGVDDETERQRIRIRTATDLCKMIPIALDVERVPAIFNRNNICYVPLPVEPTAFHPVLYIEGEKLPPSIFGDNKAGTIVRCLSLDYGTTLAVPVVAVNKNKQMGVEVTLHELGHAADLGSIERIQREPQYKLYDELIACASEKFNQQGGIKLDPNHLVRYIKRVDSKGLFQVAKLEKTKATGLEICQGLSDRIYELTKTFSVQEVIRLLIYCNSFDELHKNLLELGFR